MQRKIGKVFRFPKLIFIISSRFFQGSGLFNNIFNYLFYKNKVYVEIGRGCYDNCAYCAVKIARGDPCSRSVKEILNDIEKVYPKYSSNQGNNSDDGDNIGGKVQLYLIGDDCGSYGIDIGSSFISLLRAIHNKYPKINLGISTINPLWLIKQEKEYLDVFKDMRIYNFSLPIQSGSDRIIKKMNRKYDVKRVISIIRKIKEKSPLTYIYTNLIVGFPGETFKDYLKTLTVMKHFDAPVVIPYSDRKMTLSYDFKDKNAMWAISIKYYIAMLYSAINIFSKIIKDIQRKEKV